MFLSLLVCTNLMWSVCGLAGNMPPILTEPTVIRSKVNSTVNIWIIAEDPNGDPITYSLLYPRPPRASIGSGETHTHTHTHTEKNIDSPSSLCTKESPPPRSITITDVDRC